MQRNFILTDVMKTGNHVDLEKFISLHSLQDQQFDMTGEFYTLHRYDLDAYDRRFAIIDVRHQNDRFDDNKEFYGELEKRIELLKSQGFVFIKATPWESVSTINDQKTIHQKPYIELEHIVWSGDTSWFWWYMFDKYQNHQFDIDHKKDKPYEFLYLNKFNKDHRKKLYKSLDNNIIEQSLVSRWPEKKLPRDYEDNFPYPIRGLDQDIVIKQYQDTKYTLISESTDANTEIFMTEKIWKSIIAGHVFVVHGNYLYLQKLREMGFRTFSKYFDESYDLELDSQQRIQKICSTCKELLQKNWQDIYLNSKDMREHNKKTFFNIDKLRLEINKTLDLFLKFADSR